MGKTFIIHAHEALEKLMRRVGVAVGAARLLYQNVCFNNLEVKLFKHETHFMVLPRVSC